MLPSLKLTALVVTAYCATLAVGQAALGTAYPGANQLAAEHPFAITARDSNVVLFVPVSKSTAQALLPKNVKLLPSHPVPGLGDDAWPLILNLGLDKDLSEYSIARVDFHHGYAGIGWVDKARDGRTAFIRSFDALFSRNYFISVSSQLLAMFNSKPIEFSPAADPFHQSSASSYTASDKQHVYFELSYANATTDAAKVDRGVYADALTQGRFQNGGCLYHEQFFNYTGTDPFDIVADVTLTDSWLPSALAGRYQGVKGLRLDQHWIETIAQPCNKRAASHGTL
ncbi:unnamed protein product [Parajaminaea phylloscopi]